ncbi:TonB-dependent receptor domain-containing protein [Erythrobacter sp. JK5]|uniref:TonB-dependent receptor domain-containing protein n=1 Tax=Erythrobacter sp. JK5 TaxID=2829500 RepID=UPI001BAB58D2|nr:TonB-dependent receptor [Erythrobacter sp. JK5]QUL36613.1 TonB-dependent receptor [Erythrobacter sp. JK5]
MKKFHSNSMKALAFSASAIAFVMAGPVSAQDEGEEDQAQSEDDEDEEQVDVSTDASGNTQTEGRGITVTGSRIVRDTYSSISPLQVLTTENQQSVGAFDPAQILQRSESASGTQIDATFQGFVLDNGPASQTIDLRGLGADRTLVLVNGRRLAPAGVEGAPANPSINLIPASLVDRYDLLLDGASSVYGSDAVAGVVNAILRKDFDGLELQVNGDLNEQGAGNDFTVSAAWGFNTDRAFFGIAGEYRRTDGYKIRDRNFLSGCDTNLEIDQNGNILTVNLADNAAVLEDSGGLVRTTESECKIQGLVGRIQTTGRFGFIYFDPNDRGVPGVTGNTGINGFSESTDAFGSPVDGDGDGIRDVDFFALNTNAAEQDIDFVPTQNVYNLFAYGEYVFPGEANITPFFEAQYTRTDVNVRNNGTPQFFPWVPSNNVFNPCNIDTNPNGVDCNAIDNEFLGLVPPSPLARFALPTGFSTPTRVIPAVRGDRNNVEVRQEQYRGVLGVRGDLPFIGSSWTFEAAGVYSRSEGSSIRRGIREDRLAFALGIDPTADFNGDGVIDNDGDGIADDYISQPTSPLLAGGACDVAGLRNPGLAPADLTAGCVPVNLFSPTLYQTVVGELASQAERDYLFGERTFDTTYEQIILSAFATGDLFELPAGPVGIVLGAEWREDSIDSDPNFVASNGLFWGFFADGGASGSKWIRELFGELDIPLMAGKPWVEDLSIKVAGRLTDEEFYGTEGTYSIGAGWRPTPALLFKFNYGTSFRAPNLRENFLRNQSGFNTLFDPCAVPDAAFDSTGGGYNAANDTRDPTTLDNCRREGRDPTRVGIEQNGVNTTQFSSVEIASGGTFDLDPETSRSITTGFAFEETFGEGFDVAVNFNYYDIKLKGSIVEPNSQFIINDCFLREDGSRSPFCDRITASGLAADRFLIRQLNSGFINLNQESVRGIDINATFAKDVVLFGEAVDLNLNLRANHLIERSTLFIDENGDPSFDDDAGEFGFPSWTGRATFFLDWDKWRLTWQTRWIGEVEQQADGIDPLSDAFGNGPDGVPTGFIGDTCLGGGSDNGVVAGDGVFCRDVGFADDYFEHTISLRFDSGPFRIIAGITNLFDESPPLIDTNEVFGISNIPIGNGYDLDGREYFAQVRYRF